MKERHGIFVGLAAGFFLAGVFFPPAGAAQGPVKKAADRVAFAARVEPAVARPGETVILSVTAKIEEGWHLYAVALDPRIGPVPTTLKVTQAGPLQPQGDWREPPPQVRFDEGFQAEVSFHEGEVTFTQALGVPPGTPPGNIVLRGTVDYMLCDARGCLPPTQSAFQAVLRVQDGPPRPEYQATWPPSPPAGPVPAGDNPAPAAAAGVMSRGLLAFLWVAFTAGFLTLLTPCVFPLIPITISLFTKQAGSNRQQMVSLAVTYSAGIALTYTALGVILAVTLGAAGANRFASNPYVNLVITALFVVFALSLFGLFEIQIPSRWLTYLDKKSERGGYFGVLLMGFTFTLAAFTCTVPFVGLLLAAAAQGEWFRPLLGMLAYSAGLSAPFLALALFPQYLASLPRSGGWLNTTKVLLGFIELAAAFKFLSAADLVLNEGHIWFTRPLVLSAWVVLQACAGLYLLGKIRLPHDPPVETVGIGRLWLGMGFLTLALFLSTGLLGGRLPGILEALLPPAELSGQGIGGGATAELTWLEDYDAALAQARAENRPIFVDITGYTCTNCRWMEANIFPLPEVRRLLQQFVRVQLHTDGKDKERHQKFQVERFGTVELPLYAIMSPDDREIVRGSFTRDPAQFARFLQQGLDRWAAGRGASEVSR